MAALVATITDVTECNGTGSRDFANIDAVVNSPSQEISKAQINDLISEESSSICNGIASNRTPEILSEDEEDKNIFINKSTSTSTVKRKYRNILDSDSDEDENLSASNLKENSEENDDAASLSHNNDNKKSRRLIDSDSEEDDTIVDRNKCNTSDGEENLLEQGTKSSKSKIITRVDSDSEDESASDGSDKAEEKKKSRLNRKKNIKSDASKDKSRFKALVDTDSENETDCNNTTHSFGEENENNETLTQEIEKSGKSRTGSARLSKDEAMRQIHSETQRLVRSSAVSLPYHKPKQHSLKDFLNRKKFVPSLPQGLSTAAKVKMSSTIVEKVLKEKEKEAELFYKSSDSEEDENTAPSPGILDPAVESSASCTLVDQIPIEDTQKILKNDLQNAHNKKEIIKQGAVDIGVPRKLFIDEAEDLMEKVPSIEKDVNMEGEIESLEADPRKKIKEMKYGLRDGNAPRKLFPSDYDEGVHSPPRENDSKKSIIDDTPKSESGKDAEADPENADEGIHSGKTNEVASSSSESDANDFVLKFPDSELLDAETSREIKELSSEKNIVEESLNISETPVMSNKEYAKLNEREKSSKQENSDVVKEKENLNESFVRHGSPIPETKANPSSSEKPKIKNKLLSSLPNSCPRLRGSLGMMIDLTGDSKPDKEGVKSLFDRFIRHSVINKPAEIESSVTVLHTEKTADGLKIIENVIPYKLPINETCTDKELQKPGAKYTRLKMDLMEKMAKKRGEEWQMKEQQEKDESGNEEESDEEKDMTFIEDKVQDVADSEPEEEEEEEEEEDVRHAKSKKRKRCDFADEEAEVSGEEGDEEGEDDEEEVEDEEENISLRVDNENDSEDSLSDTEETSKIKTSKKPSRIVRAFEEDSNSQPDASTNDCTDLGGKKLERTKTDVDMFELENDKNDGWSSDAEAEFPPSQILPRDQADARSQLCKTPLTATNVLRFVSPITQLTALNSGNDTPKASPASNEISMTSQRVSGSFAVKTPIGIKESPISCDSEKRSGFQKKLFEEPTGAVNDEELMGLCSGNFTNIENEERSSNRPMGLSSSERVTETQLLRLCSGTFLSQDLDLENNDDKYERSADNNLKGAGLNSKKDSDDHDLITKDTEAPWSLQVESSSDDENSNDFVNRGKSKILKKKKIQKLELSDDDDEEERSNDERVLKEDNEEKYIDYDSEENEVVVVPKKDIKKVAASFLEAEAELSESEWGSDDEDEKDLDRLEFEEGDDEEIDENQMKDQLGKLHMRQIQDDDQREVRMLQELLFDDGDLHTDGGGRERKFKWRNIDQLGNDENLGPRANDADENGDLQEEENDLEWRKERIERDKFIEEKIKHTDEVPELLAVDSQIFKLGIKALQRSKSSQSSQKESETVVTKPVVPRTVLDLMGNQKVGKNPRILHKAATRGSFLARGDECLARMATYVKQSSEMTIVKRKDPRSFVFTHITPSTMENDEEEQKDSKLENLSAAESKTRKRKPTAGMTPQSRKKAKVDVPLTTE